MDVGPLGSERRVLPDAPFLNVPFASATAQDGLPLPSGGTVTLGVVPSDYVLYDARPFSFLPLRTRTP